jgi:hypothetical protein
MPNAQNSYLPLRLKAAPAVKMEWDDDDREFEVEDAVCADGRKYDLEFDADYLFKGKEENDD